MFEITLLQKANQTLPLKKPNLTKTLLSAKAFPEIENFFADFRGSVCRYFEDQSGKKSFKIQLTIHGWPRIDRIPRNQYTRGCEYDEHALWRCSSSKRNLPFFQAHRHVHLHFWRKFWRKLQRKKFWTEGNRHQQSEPAGHRQGG